MAFEKFAGKGKGTGLTLTIMPRQGVVRFSTGAVRKYSIKTWDSVAFYWDATESMIGITQENGASSFRVVSDGVGTRVSCTSFLKHIGLAKNVPSFRVKLELDSTTGFLVARVPDHVVNAKNEDDK